jgi:3-deoxy-manno-octulosonate cytidylyltransferase (CMP-KDO synthetase)
MSTIVAIPARLRSTRLPRKVLAPLAGRTLLEHTHEVAVRAACGPVVVLVDDPEVATAVAGFGGEVLMTDARLDSGTARIASVIAALDADVVVNLQADAPLTDPDVVAEAAEQAAVTRAPVSLPVHRITREADVHDPGVVKVVRAAGGRVLYCSRSAVPFVRDAAGPWCEAAALWSHAGIYAYQRAFLEGFTAIPPGTLEGVERLEQLRWLEAGVRLHAFEVAPQGPSVDTAADLDEVRELLLARVTS